MHLGINTYTSAHVDYMHVHIHLHVLFSYIFYSSSHSLIVLDDLHRLVEYVQVGERVTVSHSLMHVLSTLLSYSLSSG